MTVQRQIFFEGHVQGVGFRYTVKQLAAGYEITGWVRNLADGRVELQLRGERAEIDAFLTAIHASHLRSHIREQRRARRIFRLKMCTDLRFGIHRRVPSTLGAKKSRMKCAAMWCMLSAIRPYSSQ